MIAIELAAGLLLLLGGGDALVRGAVALAVRLAVPPAIVGLTLVGFGTSTPELVASLQAALSGAPGIAVGNVVGSNIANVLLILGVCALITPIAASRLAPREAFVLAAASVAMVAIALVGSLERAFGGALVAALLAYTAFAFFKSRGTAEEAPAEAEAPGALVRRPLVALAVAVAGIVGVVVGADLLVGGAVVLAERAGVSEAVIGLTLVAVGTSLPELATSVMAALRRQADVAIGNIVGSNVFNVLGILGVVALVSPIRVPEEVARFDVWVLLASALALLLLTRMGRIGRPLGLALLAAYVLYIAVQFAGT